MTKKSTIAIIVAAIFIISAVGIAITAFLSGSDKKKDNAYTEHAEQRHENNMEKASTEKEPLSEEVSEKTDAYILPESNERYIEYTEILDFDTEKLNLAKNEVYARHGFIFSTDNIAEYFENCAWYKPSVPAADFKDSVFNKYEIANIALLEDYEKLSQYTYPLKVKDGETVKVDLNGDGKLEKISLSIKEINREENDYLDFQTVITVNDTALKYDCDASLYVVDIDTKDTAKELCFERWEPNDYTGSIYWQYSADNELKEIFFENDLPIDSDDAETTEYAYPHTFLSYGVQYPGNGKITVTHKCISITQYMADVEYQLTEDGCFEYIDKVYEFPTNVRKFSNEDGDIVLTLKKELTIHKEPSESSETFTIQPQKLKITATCASKNENNFYSWSRVELEDGTTGWILPSPDMGQFDLEELFDGVFFSG